MDKTEFYRDARRDLTGPLDGIRVIDLTTAWAGPMAGCLLADFGADVVRVTAPGDVGNLWPPLFPGTQRSPAEETVNRNKRSISIDLRLPEGAQTFLRLVETADMVVENFKPGTLSDWGVGYDDCRTVKPDIVYVSVSGYGQFGPRSSSPGYDPAALAFSGWMSLNGEPDGPPTKAPTFLADDLAGLHAALGALAALRHRDTTGEGQHVDVALVDSILFQSNAYPAMAASGLAGERWANQMGVCAPTNSYECADGRHVYLGLLLDTHWQKLCVLIERDELALAPGYATNLERIENRDVVDSLVVEWCAAHTSEQVLALMADAGLVAAPVNDYAAAIADEHVRDREMLQQVTMVDGNVVEITGPAAKFSRTPTKVRHGAPRSNQHTDEVLGGLFDIGELVTLRSSNVID